MCIWRAWRAFDRHICNVWGVKHVCRKFLSFVYFMLSCDLCITLSWPQDYLYGYSSHICDIQHVPIDILPELYFTV